MKRVSLTICVLSVLCLAVFMCLPLAGCGGSKEPPEGSGEAAKANSEPLDEEEAAAARTRGVATEQRPDESETGVRVVLTDLTYTWQETPEKGLQVVMDFGNPLGGNTRARGYVFLVAQSILPGKLVTGVYPWGTTLDEGGMPVDPTVGSHLLYRDRQQLRAFIPYTWGDGYFETLKVLVFHENGRLIVNRPYDLGLTGAPGQTKRMDLNPDFDL
jgi:hypothetical protein